MTKKYVVRVYNTKFDKRWYGVSAKFTDHEFDTKEDQVKFESRAENRNKTMELFEREVPDERA